MPGLHAALEWAKEAGMVFATHTVPGTQDAVAAWAASLRLGRTWETADILPALGLVVVALGMTEAAARGIGGAVLIIPSVRQ
jgi:hypothetical protein